MGTIWLACCSCAGYAEIQREVEARDASAQILRVADVAALTRMVEAFVRSSGSVSLAVRGGHDEGLLRAVEDLAHREGVRQVVAIVDELDPGFIAQLFRAGATEVIAGDGGTPSDSGYRECPETGCGGPAVSSRDDAFRQGGAGPSGAERTRLAEGRAVGGAAASLDRAGYRFEDDLDEPDAWCVVESGAATAGSTAAPAPAGATSGTAGPMPSTPGASAGEPSASPGAAPLGGYPRDDAAGSAQAAPAGPVRPERPVPPSDGAAWPARVAPPGHVPAAPWETLSGGGAQRARLVVLVAGRGGCGKTTLAAAMALRASALGLRTAVLDLDLMFGNLASLLGVEEPHDAATLAAAARVGGLREADIVRASMRVAPGLTVWGPVRAPEQAELMGEPVEQLIGVMRGEADLIIADTSTYWSDAVAAAVAACDRCLVLGDARTGSVAAAERVIDLAARIGVARTKMASVFTRYTAHDASEDAASRFEFTTALGLKGRIADGGDELAGLSALGRLDTVMGRPGAFRTSACEFTDLLLRELGCSILPGAEIPEAVPAPERPRIRLPWKRTGGEAA